MQTRSASGIAFDPQTADLMSQAFHEAWKALEEKGNVDAAPYRAEPVREALALRIIENAQKGERDLKRLCDDALAHISNGGRQARKLAGELERRRELHLADAYKKLAEDEERRSAAANAETRTLE